MLGSLAQTASVADPWTGGVYFTLDRLLARVELVAQLERFDLVITDRSFYSTLAYQGSALSGALRARLARLQRSATVAPDRIVLLDLDAVSAVRRLSGRSTPRAPLERAATLRRVARAYRALARDRRWFRIDATLPTKPAVSLAVERLARSLPPVRRRAAGRPRRRRT